MGGWIIVAVVVFLLMASGSSSWGSRVSRSSTSASMRRPTPPTGASSATPAVTGSEYPRTTPVLDGAPQPEDDCPCGGRWIRRENSDTNGRFWLCSNYPRCTNTRDKVMRDRHGPYWREVLKPELARCRNGHPRTPSNTSYNNAGQRICSDCKAATAEPRAYSRTVVPSLARPTKPTRIAPTSCRNGHPRTSENTYVRPDGQRECRICRENARRR